MSLPPLTVEEKREGFRGLYLDGLKHRVLLHPEQYAYDRTQVPVVVDKMMAAIERGTFNKDSPTIRNVCKTLNIPYTYKGIREYLGYVK
jgi:hypothetical protein